MRAPIALALAVVVAGGAATLALSVGGNAAQPLAPLLPTASLNGRRASLATLRGEPALVQFWASWCPSCRGDASQVARAARLLHGRASVVAVDWSDSRAGATAFLRAHHWAFPVLFDPSGEVGDAYGIVGLPTTILLSAEGRIVKRFTGPQSASALVALAERG